jgi:ubiquinone/menaquinone biosynthesis C-methylase UbiE
MQVSDSRDFYEQYFSGVDHDEQRYDVGSFATTYLLKKHLPPHSNVHLNVGCGDGQAFYQISAKQHIGLDYSIQTLRGCKKAVPPGTWLIQASATALPFKPGTINAISSAHVIEHIQNDQGMIQEIARVLAGEGNFVIVTPGRYNGIPDPDEQHENGHYRRYNRVYVEKIMDAEPGLKLQQMECAHRILGGIWNRLKWVFRGLNYPLKKWILRDGKSIFQRSIYQKLFLPIIFWTLEFLDRLLRSRDRYFWEKEANDFLMVWSGSVTESRRPRI